MQARHAQRGSDLHVQALATTMKRAAASDHEFHGTPQAKRPASLPVDSFINALSTAGDKEYGDWLNFRVGYTVTKGHQISAPMHSSNSSSITL